MAATRSKSPAARTAKAKTTTTDVFLFIPNLIGYARVVLTAVCLATALDASRWQLSMACYFVSFVLDAVDGMAARRFKQSSDFGAVLDMVTDRCSTAALLVVLTKLYPGHWLWFLFLLVLDYSSHWTHMYASASAPKGQQHHKKVAEDRNFLLRWFYGVYVFFGFCCVGAELFYVGLFALKYLAPGGAAAELAGGLVWYVWFPGCVCKNAVNVAQLCSAAHVLASRDAARRNAAAAAAAKEKNG